MQGWVYRIYRRAAPPGPSKPELFRSKSTGAASNTSRNRGTARRNPGPCPHLLERPGQRIKGGSFIVRSSFIDLGRMPSLIWTSSAPTGGPLDWAWSSSKMARRGRMLWTIPATCPAMGLPVRVASRQRRAAQSSRVKCSKSILSSRPSPGPSSPLVIWFGGPDRSLPGGR